MKKTQILIVILSLILVFSCSNNTEKTENNNKIIKIETMDLSGYEQAKKENKDKVILMNFFAPWCGPCNQEAPELVNAYKNLKNKGFEIIALAVDTNEKEVNDFIAKHKINFKIYLADKTLQRKFGISSIPTNIFYAPNNQLLTVRVGGVNEATLKSLVQKYSIK